MKKFLLTLLLLLTSLPAQAQLHKYAIFQGNSGPWQWKTLPFIRLAERIGTPFDVYDPNARTWGSAGVDDSTWFRQRYDAILICSNDISNAVGSIWDTNFKNAAGSTGVVRGPLDVIYSILLYV